MGDTVLSLRNISKSFDGVTVLEDITLDFRRGEVHAIIGSAKIIIMDEPTS